MNLAIEIILVLVSVVLIVAVLMQKSKSAGLGAAYGSDNRGRIVLPDAYAHLDFPVPETGTVTQQLKLEV